MAIIGIDLGTTNSLVAAFVDGKSALIPNQFGELLTPSVVSLDADGSMLVGKIAKERMVFAPDRTAAYFKRLMGTTAKVTLAERDFSPEELSSFVIRQLVHDAEAYLGETVEEAVVSVPAYFDVSQRAATRRAGALAGIKVQRLVNEPSAAALSCRGWTPESPDEWVLPAEEFDENFIVFDFGGGTLDVSVVECFDNVISISAVSGDNMLGGRDFDLAIAKEMCRNNEIALDDLSGTERESLLRAAEAAKRDLSVTEEAFVTSASPKLAKPLMVTNESLFKLSGALFNRMQKPIKQAVGDSDIPSDEISRIILVGGSCQMPIVARYLKELLAIDVANAGDCEYSVAKGLGLYAGIRERQGAVRDLVLTDICPFSLSTDVANPNPPYDELSHVIIPRNTTLPASRSHPFFAQQPDRAEALLMRSKRVGTREIDVNVFQGEGIYTKENKMLAKLKAVVPVNFDDDEEFTVTFIYDINAILIVEIHVLSTGETTRYVYTGDSWSAGDECASLVEDVKLSLALDTMHAESQFVIERAKRVAMEGNEAVREYVIDLLAQYVHLVDSNDLRSVVENTRELNLILTRIEESKGGDEIFRS